jgi:chromosome segregation ATPase
MLESIVLAIVLLLALGYTVIELRRSRQQVESLKGDIEVVDNHNRMLQEQRDTLKATLNDTTAALASTKKRLEVTEAEKRDVEQQRAALEESAARLEKMRADLEERLGKLRNEHDSLEHRVVDFQGQWSHQLSTLEAEISTVVRQLGEFRKGTQLPMPNAAEPSEPTVVARDASWTLSAPVPPAPAANRTRGTAQLAVDPTTRVGSK